MSNEEIAVKFRSLMNRRKDEESRKKNEMSQEDFGKQLKGQQDFNHENSGNMEVSSSSHTESTTISQIEEPKEKITNPARPLTKRVSVYDLAMRFEKNNEKEQAASKAPASKKENQDESQEKPITEECKTQVQQELVEQAITSKHTAQEPEEIKHSEELVVQEKSIIDNPETDQRKSINLNDDIRSARTSDYKTATGRSSTNRKMITNKLRSYKEEYLNEPRKSYIPAITGTDAPRKSVKDLISMNENRLKATRDTVTSVARNSNTEFAGRNLAGMKRFIDQINAYEGNKDTFMINNEEEMRRLGIAGKGFKSVEDLIGFYNTLRNKQPEYLIGDPDSMKRRNSVNPATRQAPQFAEAYNNDKTRRSTSMHRVEAHKFLSGGPRDSSNLNISVTEGGRPGVYSNRNPNLSVLKDLSGKDVNDHKPISSKNSVQNLQSSLIDRSRSSSTSQKYQKNIIDSLNSISVQNYNIGSNIPLDPTFFDILCTNCYECVKPNEVDRHSDFCIMQSDESNSLY